MYITKNKNLYGLGAVIGDCMTAKEFASYRSESSKNRINYQTTEINIPNEGVKKGWLFDNGEFWSLGGGSQGITYCYKYNTKNNSNPIMPTPYPSNPPASGGGNTIMPVQKPEQNPIMPTPYPSNPPASGGGNTTMPTPYKPKRAVVGTCFSGIELYEYRATLNGNKGGVVDNGKTTSLFIPIEAPVFDNKYA